MVENLSQELIVAKRIIHDHIKSVGGLENVVITKKLLLFAAGARQKYLAYLDSQKKKVNVTNEKRKLTDDIEELKKKKKCIENDIEDLSKPSIKYAEKAEKTGKISLISKSNALCRQADEKNLELKNISRELDEKCLELKNC